MKKAKKPSSKQPPKDTAAPTSGSLDDRELDQVSGGVRFSESDVRQIAGGTSVQVTQDITTNKAKTADKAYTQMDAYIKQ